MSAKPANEKIKAAVAATSLKLRALQRQRTIVMKSRNMNANRLQAIVAGTIGYSANMTEGDRKKKFQEASALIKAVVDDGEDHPMADVIRVSAIGIEAFENMKASLEKAMVKAAKTLPVMDWVRHPDQRGFGELFLAIVIGETGDLNLYENPAKVWRRMACAPWEFDGRCLMGATWRSGKEGRLPSEEWEKYGYSPRRRSISYLIGESLVKSNGVNGPYRRRWLEAKVRAAETHPEWPWTDCIAEGCKGKGDTSCPTCGGTGLKCQRANLHGRLLASKRLLLNLWVEWTGAAPGGWGHPGYRPGTEQTVSPLVEGREKGEAVADRKKAVRV